MNVCLRCLKQESKRELRECGHVNIFTVTAAIIWTITRFFLSFGLHDTEEKICSLRFSCFSKADEDQRSSGAFSSSTLSTLVVLQVFPGSSALLDLLHTIISDLPLGLFRPSNRRPQCPRDPELLKLLHGDVSHQVLSFPDG